MSPTAGTIDLRDLSKDIDGVEFKYTLETADEAKVPEFFGGVLGRPKRRKVYFYDTRKLKLFNAGLVLRARVTQGEDDDSTVKVRPASLDRHAPWREGKGVVVELDVSGKGPMCSAKGEGTPKHGHAEAVEAGRRPVGALFSSQQEKLLHLYAKGVKLDELKVLGPVDARKWELDKLDGFPYTLCVEEWTLPDTTRFIELSIKADRKDAPRAKAAFDKLLRRHKITVVKGKEQKTPLVLKFFADRL
ncbi:hypothetical protein OJ997_15440 [Solirubrobacter phytolaccae]|uniref:CYTH domain-containing protein n=1 Tax=Solirubrobacter phytolaccae TaxID=1404360 RepID=A0A9X3S820_9ACTN|nr:hypothetical protein [Solirubrobacter phytolaccae]MDA0181699.1 hypothetical protein [Solirubrobacter phytolaccae]